jgi:hypothetical protein
MHLRIISASRRTDIPAFYGQWFMRRVRAGWCAMPNPFNSKQVSRVELRPDITLLVFWTRWAAPFLKAVAELKGRGFRFYFQYTLVNYPAAIDPYSPPLDRAVAAFRRLTEAIGPERVVWRYYPILLSDATDHAFHLENFARIAKALDGATRGVVISILDPYAKAARRLDRLGKEQPEFKYRVYDAERDGALMQQLARIAQAHSLRIQSCAETMDLTAAGIAPGKCIDDQLIREVFGIDVSRKKDKGQRTACGCIESRDIGMYDSCLFGCVYCYATRSFKAAGANHAARDPESASMIGQHRALPLPERRRTREWSI